MTSRAPRLATWLLVRFSSGPHGEAIAGDLMEQYAARPSRAWYWRQVLSAIRADVIQSVSENRWRTIAAIAFGWIAYYATSFPVNALIRPVRRIAINWLIDTGRYTPDWIMSASFIVQTLLVGTVCILIGWGVSIVSRRSAPAAACAMAATLLIFEFSMMVYVFSTNPRRPESTVEMIGLLTLLVRPAAVLLGGVIGAREAPRSAVTASS